MEVIGEILKNKYIVIPLLLWFCIQIFKVIYDLITTKNSTLKELWEQEECQVHIQQLL